MLDNRYFYNATVRKTVAIFGSLFNNIYTGKMKAGKLEAVTRVPLSYGPRERFLIRIRDADNSTHSDIAVKLPRMSFEITSIAYDQAAVLNKNNKRTFDVTGNTSEKNVVRQATPYILGMQLSILADNQDTGLQIIEQILPSFAPEYTVTVKDMEGIGSRSDMPIILNGVNLQDDYEGDFESGRRTIIYTLDFTIKIKFVGSVIEKSKIVKSVTVNISSGNPCDDPKVFADKVNLELGDPINDTEDNYTVVTTFGFD